MAKSYFSIFRAGFRFSSGHSFKATGRWPQKLSVIRPSKSTLARKKASVSRQRRQPGVQKSEAKIEVGQAPALLLSDFFSRVGGD
jgi:hypothetical protein